ncbi:MAG: response regulator transcription factor [Clostridia bacterium]|nr:response regulator transcription factor [Clostridia bacterium]
MIKIAIVEDNPQDADRLRNYAERALESFGETGEITLFTNAVSFLEGYRGCYDVVFMDIELPDLNGMDTAKRLRAVDKDVVLIFVTNMAQFALGGYAVDAMDFMVKPVSYDNLAVKMSRALNKLSAQKEEKIIIQGKTGATVLSVSKIKYVEVMNHKVIFYTTDGKVSSSGSLSKFEEKLPKRKFSRCNNCYLVNLDYVTGVDDFTAYIGKESLPISRSRKKPFLKDIADYLGGG